MLSLARLKPRLSKKLAIFFDFLNLSSLVSRPCERNIQPMFQDLGLGIELIQLTHPLALTLKRRFRKQADDLSLNRRNLVPLSQLEDRAVNLGDRRHLEVCDIHRELSPPMRYHSHGLYSLQASIRRANLLGY